MSTAASRPSPRYACRTKILLSITAVSVLVAAAARAQEPLEPLIIAEPPPPAPQNFTATAVSSSQIDLSWSEVTQAEGGVQHYNLYREGQRIAQVTATSYSDTGLQEDTGYDYEVAAVDGKGREGDRAQASAKTLDDEDDGSDTTPPGQPGSLQASVLDTSTVDVSWSPASDAESGIKEYVVYRDGTEVARVTGTLYVDGGLLPSTTYSYEVSAVNGDGLEGGKAGPVTAQTPAAEDDSPPTAPADLNATVEGPGEVRLSWSPAQDPESGISGYRVYRDGTEVAFVSSTSFSDTGLDPETRYAYRVAAVNGDGLQGRSTFEVAVQTPAALDTVPPAPPTGLRIIPAP